MFIPSTTGVTVKKINSYEIVRIEKTHSTVYVSQVEYKADVVRSEGLEPSLLTANIS